MWIFINTFFVCIYWQFSCTFNIYRAGLLVCCIIVCLRRRILSSYTCKKIYIEIDGLTYFHVGLPFRSLLHFPPLHFYCIAYSMHSRIFSRRTTETSIIEGWHAVTQVLHFSLSSAVLSMFYHIIYIFKFVQFFISSIHIPFGVHGVVFASSLPSRNIFCFCILFIDTVSFH